MLVEVVFPEGWAPSFTSGQHQGFSNPQTCFVIGICVVAFNLLADVPCSLIPG